jgi:polyhydroxyalkanoate synthase
LINRSYILDLAPNVSLLEFLCQHGFRPLLLDWGASAGPAEPCSIEDLILERMKPALNYIQHTMQRRPLIMGYCMGGTLATALACLAPQQIAGLALLATPWDFHRNAGVMKTIASCLDPVASFSCFLGDTPVDALQTLFAQIDPLAIPKKFSEFAKHSQESEAATRFVAIEDWLNDGVCLDAGITKECLQSWYISNEPARGLWKVDQMAIRPDQLDLPVWMAVPAKDRLVPPQSSLTLAQELRHAEVHNVPCGHISLVAGLNAEETVWLHLLRWLKQIAALQKKSW